MSVLRYVEESVQTPGKLASEGPGVARSRHPWKLRSDLYEFCDLEVGNKEELT